MLMVLRSGRSLFIDFRVLIYIKVNKKSTFSKEKKNSKDVKTWEVC